MTIAFIAQVPEGPAHEVLDVVPLMMSHQDTFIAGATWARLKSKFPELIFDGFWWTKVSLYDKRNQEARKFWWDADFTDRQVERMLFGSGSTSSAMDDIEDEDALDFFFRSQPFDFGRGWGSKGSEAGATRNR
jgi:hypothetical protein